MKFNCGGICEKYAKCGQKNKVLLIGTRCMLSNMDRKEKPKV